MLASQYFSPALSASLVMVLVTACGSGGARAQSAPRPERAPHAFNATDQNLAQVWARRAADLIAPLQAACHEATGAELDAAGVCLCPNRNEQFYVDRRTKRGKCKRVSMRTEACAEVNRDDSSVEAMNACLHSLAEFEINASGLGTHLTLEAPPDRDQRVALRGWLESHTPETKPPILWKPFEFDNQLRVRVGLGAKPPTRRDALENGLLVRNFVDEMIAPFSTLISEPEVEQLSAILGMRDLSTHERRQLFWPKDDATFRDRQTRADLHAAYDALVLSETALAFTDVTALGGHDCTAGCALMSQPLQVGPDAQATLERTYAHGTVARESLWYRRGGELRAHVVLGPNRVPGMIALLTSVTSPTRAGGELRLYDRQWHELKNTTFWVPDAFSHLDTVRKESRVVSPTEPMIALCEASTRGLLNDSDGMNQSLAFGPSPPIFSGQTLMRGSLFGWFDNVQASTEVYLNGWTSKNFGFLPGWNEEHSNEQEMLHGREVVRSALAEVPNLRILPIGRKLECFAQYNDWHTNVPRSSTVVSMSSAPQLEALTCRSRILPTLHQSESQTLWVVGAGNTGDTAAYHDSPTMFCPASLTGQKNLLVVAGSDHDELAAVSIFGKEYADLAADAYALGRKAAGTSLATPRVAAVAAELSQAWPSLSPEGLRLVLMASSRFTPSLRDTVRSGGLLDPEAARRLAPCVAESLPFERPAIIPGTLHGCLVASGFSYEFADEKIQLLLERGGLGLESAQ